MTEQVYNNGYVYSTGVTSLGASCVAPVLEFSNRLREPVAVTWQTRVAFGDDDVPVDPISASRLLVLPGELALIANFYPSVGWKRSLLTIESDATGLDAYIFFFVADRGYSLVRLPFHWARDPATGSLTMRPDDVATTVSRAVVGEAYRPGFCGNFQPQWRDCLFLPTTLLPTTRYASAVVAEA